MSINNKGDFLRYLFVSFLLALFFVVEGYRLVSASCLPTECGDAKYPDRVCESGYHCTAKCCEQGTGGTGGTSGGGGGGGTCSIVAPAITSIDPLISDPIGSVTINWNPGGAIGLQAVQIADNVTALNNFCNTAGQCVFDARDLPVDQSTITTNSVLSAGKTYFIRVVHYKTGCSAYDQSNYTTSCFVSPSSLSLPVGSTKTLTTEVTAANVIGGVSYTSGATGIAKVNPALDTYKPDGFSTVVTGVAPGTTYVDSKVLYANGSTACSDRVGVTVTGSTGAWWQVVDSDVVSSTDIQSNVPSSGTKYFDVVGDGGYPGVVVYGGTTNLTSNNVSAKKWIANTEVKGKIFNYSYFSTHAPTGVTFNAINPANVAGSLNTAGVSSYGYEWYKFTGPGTMTINANVNVGTRKVIVFVDNANVVINNNVLLNDGSGFLGFFVGGNISLASTVTSIEGIYEADGTFSTGTAGTDSALQVRGSVAAYGGFNLQRNLLNNANPAEIFTYAPDLIIRFPSVLASRNISWKEVAP